MAINIISDKKLKEMVVLPQKEVQEEFNVEKDIETVLDMKDHILLQEKDESEERTLILDKSDDQRGYGFHLFGQNPIVISTIEPGSVADCGGLLVGDRLVLINDCNVQFSDLSEIIQLIASDCNRLKLCVSSAPQRRHYGMSFCSGYLWKQEGFMKTWKMRWCALRDDNFIYFYKHEADFEPLSAICLRNYIVKRATTDLTSQTRSSFRLEKYGEKTVHLQADNHEDMNRWAKAINLMKSHQSPDIWLDISLHNVSLPALSIKNPDCHGFLTKVGHHKKTWRRRYCVLKTACLYYYTEQTALVAKGVAHLHSYKLKEGMPYNRRFGFSMVPPACDLRTYYFCADNETDLKRLIYT